MAEIWTVGSLLQWTKQYFSGKGVENSRLDAEVLLSSLIGKDRLYLYVHFDQPMEPSELTAFRDWVRQRASRIPVAYIIGRKEFMGCSFSVSPAVLIPRPETEHLVEAAQQRLQGLESPRILDIGLGSGAVLISLLSRLPQGRGVGTDISDEALTIAKSNAEKLIPGRDFQAQHADLFPCETELFHAIVSNPPYIKKGDLAGLAPEIRCEPTTALDGGEDGLDCYRRILGGAAKYLLPGGFLAMEIGAGQGGDIIAIAASNGWALEQSIPDYAGIERVLVFSQTGEPS